MEMRVVPLFIVLSLQKVLSVALSFPKKDITAVEGCEGERRHELATQLEQRFERSYAQSVRDVFATLTGPAMLTVGEWHTNELLFNFMAHVNRTARTDGADLTVADVALDEKNYQACEVIRKENAKLHGKSGRRGRRHLKKEGKVNVFCINLAHWLPDEFFTTDAGSTRENEVRFGTCPYNFIIWSKPHILKAAVESTEHAVLMIDTDVVLKHDLVKEGLDRLAQGEKRDVAMVTGIENSDENRVNTGTVMTKKGRFALEILKSWCEKDAKFLNDDHGDQAALQALFNVNHRLRQYAMTFEDAVGECSRDGRVATHYNCYANKYVTIKRKGDWDLSSQQMLKDAGLFSLKDLTPQLPQVQRTIEAMSARGDWLMK